MNIYISTRICCRPNQLQASNWSTTTPGPGHKFGRAEVYQRLRATKGRCKRNWYPSTAHGMLSALRTNGPVAVWPGGKKQVNLCLDGFSRGVWFCPDTRDKEYCETDPACTVQDFRLPLCRFIWLCNCHAFFLGKTCFGIFVVGDLLAMIMMHLPKD